MSAKFNQDLHESRSKEQDLVTTLSWMGYCATTTRDLEEFNEYDVVAWVPTREHSRTTYEVKYDKKANATGYVAVEVCKEIDGVRQPSGLTVSKAHYQAYCFPETPTFYVVDSTILGQMVVNQEYTKKVVGGDGGRTVMVLFDREYFISKCSKL